MFLNRKDAGLQLAKKLFHYKNQPNTLILALPRGGVPIAFPLKQKLNLPLDVFLVRKLGIPGNEETAMGAISTNNIIVLNEDLINYLNISSESIQSVIAREKMELEYRNNLYHENRTSLKVTNQNIILVDDGMATGSTMKAAVAALKKAEVKEIVIAVPVSSKSAYEELSLQVKQVISLLIPSNFNGVGEWYKSFSQVSHEEVKELLNRSI